MKEGTRQDDVLYGVKLAARYLGCCMLPKSGGTDNNIARVIHETHSLYKGGKRKVGKALEVSLIVDGQRVSIFAKDELLFDFALYDIRDVTVCVDRGPYSKTCVLVAKASDSNVYKAFVFHTKTEERAVGFHQNLSVAFQVGYKLQKQLHSNSTSSERPSTSSASSGVDVESGSQGDWSDEDDAFQGGVEIARHATTVRISSQQNAENGEQGTTKEGFVIADSRKLSQSKIALYLEDQKSRFPLPKWMRRVRKLSGKQQTHGEEHREESHVLIPQ